MQLHSCSSNSWSISPFRSFPPWSLDVEAGHAREVVACVISNTCLSLSRPGRETYMKRELEERRWGQKKNRESTRSNTHSRGIPVHLLGKGPLGNKQTLELCPLCDELSREGWFWRASSKNDRVPFVFFARCSQRRYVYTVVMVCIRQIRSLFSCCGTSTRIADHSVAALHLQQ